MPQQPAPEPDPARSAEDRKAWELVDQAISALGDPGAAVLRAYVEHLQLRPGGSYTTLARQFDTKVGTISSTVWRCVDRLLEDPRVSEALGVERVRAIKAIKAQKRPRAPRPSRREERRP